MKTITTMFTPFQIGEMTVPNRLVRSATFEFGADDGKITPRITQLYRALAEGGSGLIIAGMQAVTAGARSNPLMIETTYDGYVADMKQIADITHEQGKKLLVQLNHAGYKTAKNDAYDRYGVSEQEVAEGFLYREATFEDLKKLAKAFAASALRCKEAGCNGVQIHAGHGYLLNTFLSPFYNHRTDYYGGKIENRARIVFELYDCIREAVGKDFLISIKIPFGDLVSPSITPDECIYVCKELEKKGIDMIEVTSGMTMDGGASSFTPFVRNESEEAAFLDGAVQIAKAVKIPVLTVCGYRTPDLIDKVLNETPVAAVSLCRPLIREPNLPNRWKSDRAKAACISCNRCYKSSGMIACQVID